MIIPNAIHDYLQFVVNYCVSCIVYCVCVGLHPSDTFNANQIKRTELKRNWFSRQLAKRPINERAIFIVSFV